MDLHICFISWLFKGDKCFFFLVCAICLLDTVSNIRVGQIEIELDRVFVKHRLNFV